MYLHFKHWTRNLMTTKSNKHESDSMTIKQITQNFTQRGWTYREKKDSVLGPIFCNMFINSLAKKANAHDTKLGGIAKTQEDRNIQIYMVYDSLNSQN